MIDTNDVEQIMMNPNCLLQVHVEASTIRELLLEFHSRIENIDKRMIDILKSREMDQMQKQIDEITSKIESIEFELTDLNQLKNAKTTPEQLNESIDRRIEESRVLNDQIFRKLLQDSINEAKSNLEESIQTNRQEIESNSANKYATSDMIAQLQSHLEAAETRVEQASPHISSSRSKSRLTPRQPNSTRNSMYNISTKEIKEKAAPASLIAPPGGQNNSNNEALQNSINELKKKIEDTEVDKNEFTNCINKTNAQIKELKTDLLLLRESTRMRFENLDNNSNTNLNSIQPSTSEENKEVVTPTTTETIIKTVQEPVDLDKIKSEVSKAVLDQILPYVNDAIEKVDEIQKNSETPEDEIDNKPPQFIISTTEGIFEAQPEIQTPKSDNSTRGLSEALAKRALSSTRDKRNPVDPRVSNLETQQKALKEHVEALETAIKSQYDFIDSRMHDISLRTASIEKHIEDQGEKIQQVIEDEITKTSIAIQADNIEETSVADMVNRYTSPIPSSHSNRSQISNISSENSRAITPILKSTEPSHQPTPKSANPLTPPSQNPSTPVTEKQSDDKPPAIEEKEEMTANPPEQSMKEKSEPEEDKFEVKQIDKLAFPAKTIVRPSSASSMSSGRSDTVPRFSTPVRINTPTNNLPSMKKDGLLPLNLNSIPKSSSVSSRSSHSHMTSQTYEEIDTLTKQLEMQVSELNQQMTTVIDRLSEKDKQIHQLSKAASNHVTKDDLEEMKVEIDERNSFNRKNNPNQETVTTTQLKRVVANFQGSIKTIDKQLDSMREIVPQFVTKEELTELVEAVTQLAIAQTKENSTSTAGGTLTYKCLLCGRPTNQVTGMITEGEVARMIGEPPIIGATAGNDAGQNTSNDIVLVYGKEGSRVPSQMTSTRRKKVVPLLTKVTPNVTQLNSSDLGNSATENA